MDYTALLSLINSTPGCSQYITPNQPKVAYSIAQVNDQAIADILNNTTGGVVYTELSAAQFTTWAVATDMRSAIQVEADDLNSTLRSSALAMLDVMQGNVPGIDFSEEGLRNVISVWVSASKCSPSAQAALMSMCSKEVGLAEYTLGQKVSPTDVGKAIRGI